MLLLDILEFQRHHMNSKVQGKNKGPKVVLNQEEKEALKTYMRDMVDYGHSLTTEQLKL